jgi:integron integrase
MESRMKLLDQLRIALRLRHMSLRTEQVYVGWTRRFILFHNKRHPKDMGAEEIRAFLTHLAINCRVAASTQNVALNALPFLYRHVLQQDLPALDNLERAKRPRRVPTVFTREEVTAVLTQLTSMYHLMASLLYGAGLRLMECLCLRVKDIDFAYHQITVRDGKGGQDRVTMLPRALAAPLQRHLARVKLLHEADLLEGYGAVYLSYAFDRKDPSAEKSWLWQYVFPASKRSIDPRSGVERRHHAAATGLQKAIKDAMRQAGTQKHGSCHTFRHNPAYRIMPSTPAMKS